MPQYEPQAGSIESLSPMVRGYLECAEWCGIADEREQQAFVEFVGRARWSERALAEAVRVCESFKATAGELLAEWSDAQAGHDLWLTRNGHGAGFWDRGWNWGSLLSTIAHGYGECNVWFDEGAGLLEFEP